MFEPTIHLNDHQLSQYNVTTRLFLREVNNFVNGVIHESKMFLLIKNCTKIYDYLDSKFEAYEIYYRKSEPSKIQAEILLRLKVLNKYGTGNNVIIYDFDLDGIPGRLYYKIEKE